MARRSVPEKVRLLVNFLLGVRHIEVHRALAQYGWSKEKVDQGWRLAERAGRARFSDDEPSIDRPDAELLAFKKLWFPIVRIALERRYPEFIGRLIGGPQLSTESGAALLVEPFLTVLGEFEASPDPHERTAREILCDRGLSREVVGAALLLVRRCREVIPADLSFSFLDAEEAAERELWDFYVEWSAIARRVIDNRSLLRLLGLYKPGPVPRTGPAEVSLRAVRGADSSDSVVRPLALPAGDQGFAPSAARKSRTAKKKIEISATPRGPVR